jgi:hypothetical protein
MPSSFFVMHFQNRQKYDKFPRRLRKFFFICNITLLFYWVTYIITLSIIGKEGDFHNAVRIHY